MVHSMRKLGGHNVKSALTHTYVRDTRDDPFMATQGSYLKLVQVSSQFLHEYRVAKHIADWRALTLFDADARNTPVWVEMPISSSSKETRKCQDVSAMVG